jgi:hypothetical protein
MTELFRRLRYLLNRRRFDRELECDMQFRCTPLLVRNDHRRSGRSSHVRRPRNPAISGSPHSLAADRYLPARLQ